MKPAATDTDLHPVMILAGGTGGHIFPGLAVARALRERGQPVLWLGAQGGMETRLVPQHDIAIDTIAVSGVRGKGLATLLAAPFKLLGTVRAAGQVLRQRQPRAVTATRTALKAIADAWAEAMPAEPPHLADAPGRAA